MRLRNFQIICQKIASMVHYDKSLHQKYLLTRKCLKLFSELGYGKGLVEIFKKSVGANSLRLLTITSSGANSIHQYEILKKYGCMYLH